MNTSIGIHSHSTKVLIISNTLFEQLVAKMTFGDIITKVNSTSFFTPSDAISYLFEQNILPRLIILDFNVGERVARTFVTLLRNSRNLDNIPLIALCGNGVETKGLFEIGVSEVYEKTDDLFELIRVFHEINRNWLSHANALSSANQSALISA